MEGFSDAVNFIRGIDSRVILDGNYIVLGSGCDEIENIRNKPLRLLLIYDARDWVQFLRGLYDFNGELFDPEPSIDMPNLVLMIKIPSARIGELIRVVLKFIGVSSDLFKGENGLFIVVHDRESLARFIRTVKPHIDPKSHMALRGKWIRFYDNVGEPLIRV